MESPITSTHAIMQSLQAAEGAYYRLVLVVGRSDRQTAALQPIAQAYGSAVTNLSLVLSEKLIEMPAHQHPLRLQETLQKIIDAVTGLVILDNLALLFNPACKIDPLRLLQQLARNRLILAAWGGAYTSGQLSYAAPGHPEYHCYEAVDMPIVAIDE